MKLGADQYNSQADMQGQDSLLRGQAQRRLGRRKAFQGIGEAGKEYLNDKMYQTMLDKYIPA